MSGASTPSQSKGPASEGADLVLFGGAVRTADGFAEALAVAGDRIVAVGTSAQMLALARPDARTVDLDGSTVLPGFNDMHLHPMLGGLRQQECKIPQGSDFDGFAEAIEAHFMRLGPDDWLTGGQWDASSLGRVPNRFDLDQLTGDRPALLNDTSGHSALANSAALRLAGIDIGTPDPAQGIIERLADGRPSGILRERAIELVLAHQPKPDHEKLCAALAWSHQMLASLGITSCTEASIGMNAGAEAELEAYRTLCAEGRLPQRTRIFLIWEPDDAVAEDIIARRGEFAHELLDLDCVKIHLDGVPTDGHTAAMIEPYEGALDGRDDEAARFGLLLQDSDVLAAAVTRFDAAGLVVKYHAVGDRAVREGLDAIAAARRANGPGGPRHEIGHSTFVAVPEIGRGVSLDAVFELSPYLWAPCPINDDIIAAVGPGRVDRIWPFRELIDAGAKVVAGSDWPVVDDPNPWPAIETLLTRRRPGSDDAEPSFGRTQAIGLAEAISLFTDRPAEVLGKGHELGKIAPGFLADLVVLDLDPFVIPVQQLHAIKPLATFVGGRCVWPRMSRIPENRGETSKEPSRSTDCFSRDVV